MKRPTRPLVEERGQHCEAHVDFGFIVHTASATRQDQVLLHLFRDDLLAEAQAGKRGVFFVEAAHFVFGALLGYL